MDSSTTTCSQISHVDGTNGSQLSPNCKNLCDSFPFISTYYRNEEAAIISKLVLQNNLTWPNFTYREFVFPQVDWVMVDLPDPGTVTSNSTGVSFQSTIPALHPNIECSPLEGKHLSIEYRERKGADGTDLVVNIETDGCQSSVPINLSSTQWRA